MKVKGPEKPKDEGSRIVSVNFKRRIVRCVICFVHNVFTFTSLGISSLKLLLSFCEDQDSCKTTEKKGELCLLGKYIRRQKN